MVVSCVTDLGDIAHPRRGVSPSGYFTRRLQAPPREAFVDWPATAERGIVAISPKLKATAQYRGLVFERKITEAFSGRFGLSWFPQPVFRYFSPKERGRAIPDGLLFSSEEILVVEIKFNFRREDLGQLEDFYLPVVRRAFPRHQVSGMIVCKNLLDYGGIQQYQILYGECDLDSLRVRRFTQYLLVGRVGSAFGDRFGPRAKGWGNADKP